MALRIEEGRVETVKDLLVDAMGEWHAYYAIEAVKSGVAKQLVAILDDTPVGAVIYYILPTTRGEKATIIYYVVVAEKARKEGVGRALVLSVEEEAKSDAYMATIAEGNTASIRMFQSIGYEILPYKMAESIIGRSALARIERAACAYEDSYLAYKPAQVGLDILARLDPSRVETVFKKICYEPWRRLKSGMARV